VAIDLRDQTTGIVHDNKRKVSNMQVRMLTPLPVTASVLENLISAHEFTRGPRSCLLSIPSPRT